MNRHKHTNLVALTQLIQYHTKTDNVTTKGKAIDNRMNNMGVNISKRNQVAVMQLCSMLHRTIKRRGAVFSSLRDSVLFCIEVPYCQVTNMPSQKWNKRDFQLKNQGVDHLCIQPVHPWHSY